MADYKAIKGHNIQTVAGDISPVTLGDIWYSSATKKIRVGKTTAGAWSSGGNVNSARYTSGSGTQTATLIAGGYLSGDSALCEEYDGSSWAESGDLNNNRQGLDVTGIQTAALAIAGWDDSPTNNYSVFVEQYDGSTWTEVGDLNAPRGNMASAGTVTAALVGGGGGPSPNTGLCEIYDGSTWTEVADFNTARSYLMGGGTSTAAIALGGQVPDRQALTETWNGSSWTETGDLNTARSQSGTSQSAPTNAFLAFGGSFGPPGDAALTEEFNGSSWSEIADLSTARYTGGGAGASSSTAIYASGFSSTVLNVTEEWTGESVAASSITSS